MRVREQELKKALTPPGIKPAYAKESFDIATDIMSIPGTYTSSVDDASDSAYMMDAMKAFTSPNAPDRVVKRDTKFSSNKRHSLGKATGSEEAFNELYRTLGEEADACGEQFEANLTTFMCEHTLLKDRKISRLISDGPMAVILYKTLVNYKLLLDTVRQVLVSGLDWESGPAQSTLEHHAKELLKIRRHSNSRYEVITKNYVYLRDAAAVKFDAPEINRQLWTKRAVVGPICPPLVPQDSPENSGKASCGWCRSALLHSIFRPKIGNGGEACPLYCLSKETARALRLKVITAFQADNSISTIDAAFIRGHM